MSNTIKKTINDPDLSTVLANFKKDIFTTINCVQIGKIDSYDKDTQSCTIKIQVKRKISDTESKEYPLLVDCPVFVYQGGGAYIDMPIQKGDYCLVLFNDRDLDIFIADENFAEPNTNRKHSLSDGIALIGINSFQNPLDLDGNKFRIITNDYVFEIYTKTKEVKIYNDNGKINLTADGKIIFNEGTDYAVRYNEMKTQLDQLKSDFDDLVDRYNVLVGFFNGHDHDGVQSGSGTTGPVSGAATTDSHSTADFANCKVDNIQLEGVGE